MLLLNTEVESQEKLTKANLVEDEILVVHETKIAKAAEAAETKWKEQQSLLHERWEGMIDKLRAKMVKKQEKHISLLNNTIDDLLNEWNQETNR